MRWTRAHGSHCASANCSRTARWHGTAGDVGSDYCSECRDAIDCSEIEAAAREVLAFDWSDSDSDTAAAIDRLRKAVANS
jgi:hypothetical protein